MADVGDPAHRDDRHPVEGAAARRATAASARRSLAPSTSTTVAAQTRRQVQAVRSSTAHLPPTATPCPRPRQPATDIRLGCTGTGCAGRRGGADSGRVVRWPAALTATDRGAVHRGTERRLASARPARPRGRPTRWQWRPGGRRPGVATAGRAGGSGHPAELPAGAAGTASGCRIAAIASTPSTSRGPGRTTRPSRVDRPDLRVREARRHRRGLRRPRRRGGSRTARRARPPAPRRRSVRPGGLRRAGARAGGHRLAAGGADQVGHPVPGGERRVDPLHDRDPGPRPAGHRRGHRGQPRPQAGDQGRRPAPARRRRAPTARIVSSTSSSVCGSSDSTSARQPRWSSGVGDLAGRQRAHPAQVLGQDQVGVEAGQRARVQGVEVGAGGELPRT